ASRTRTRSRSTRVGSARSPRSPRREPASRPGRRRRRAASGAPRTACAPPRRRRRPCSWSRSYLTPVRAPAVDRARSQRGADEAVPFRPRQELPDLLGRRSRLQLDVELDLELDEGIAPVLLAFRHAAGGPGGGAKVGPDELNVEAEALDRAAGES